jgi:cytoskeletal protein RodZ
MAKEKNKTEIPQLLGGELQARLISLREEAGYSITQMADALCLSEDVITNLENEAFDLLAEPPYIRGYLRNYAKLGETDPSDLVNCYETLRGADSSELDYKIKSSSHIASSKTRRLSPVIAQLILLALLIAGITLVTMIPGVNQWFKNTWENFSTQFQTQTSEVTNNPLLTGTMPVPIPLPETPEANNINPEESTDTTNTDSGTNQNNESQVTPETPESSPLKQTTSQETIGTTPTEIDTKPPENVTEQSIPTEASSQANTDNQINIKLVFNKDVWLRIKNKDSKTVYEGLNKTGTDKALSFEKPLTFRVGNAQGLSLFVDDKAVDISAYIKGSVANFTLE